jgi:hypothetical protein
LALSSAGLESAPAAGAASEIQIMYGIGAEMQIDEQALEQLRSQ